MFLAGKGGVGKTTCAAGLALALAERPPRPRVLVASVDPAHSLGDALGLRLGAAASPIPGTRGHGFAVEVAAERAARRWLAARRPALESLAESAGALDREDVARLLALPLPAVDEFAALLGLARWAAADYDRIVVDTAPSGHFLELIRTPGLLGELAHGFDAARVEAREVRARLSGRSKPEASDRFIDELEGLARSLAALLADPTRSAVRWVTTPDAMSLAETRDGLGALAAAGLRVEEIIVNRWPRRTPRTGPGERERRRVLAELAREWPTIPLRLLSTLPDEPRGRAALRRVGRVLTEAPARVLRSDAREVRTGRAQAGAAARPRSAAVTRAPARRADRQAPDAALLAPELRLLLVTGKGGVGKTTTAAALALRAATLRWPGAPRPVRLVSVDPAHSLADVLGVRLDDRWRRVSAAGLVASTPGAELRARELAADAVWRSFRRRLDAVLERDPPAAAAWSDLIGAPEGFPEIAAALALAATLDAYPRALLIVDCPPTGHALRLIAAPALAVEWIHAGLATLLKYRQVAPLGPFADWLLHLAQSLTRMRDLVRDPARSATVVVTRPGAVIEAETRRLERHLRRVATPAAALITLGAQPLSTSRRRGARTKACAIIDAPACDPPPSGIAELLRWVGTWTSPP